ncbi:hypothetical protein ACFLZB_02840 [Nanoarchaeota archaeon]
MTEQLTLQAILKTGSKKWRISHPDFNRLKNEALEDPAAFGLDEVVVVDFADPDCILKKDLSERHEIMDGYEGKKVVFFHDNVNRSDPNFLAIAAAFSDRSYAVMSNPDHTHITYFDDMLVTEDGCYSLYVAKWAIPPVERSTWHSEDVNDTRFRGINKFIKELRADWDGKSLDRAFLINVVGKANTGKTTLLKNLGITSRSEYFDMRRFVSEDDEKTTDYILDRQRGGILLLDEANLVTPQVHEWLSPRYRIQVYASHSKVQFPVYKEFCLEKPGEK